MYNQRGKTKENPSAASPIPDSMKKATGKLYKNPLDCLIQTVRAEGPLAVYKVRLNLEYHLTSGIFCTFITDCASYHIVIPSK
jgi:hypothetical protein